MRSIGTRCVPNWLMHKTDSGSSSPFETQGRHLLPPLLDNLAPLPALTRDNQLAGIEKRVLAVVPKPHPDLVMEDQPKPRPFHHCPSVPTPERSLIKQMGDLVASTGKIPPVAAQPFLGIPPIYLVPLSLMPDDWVEEVVDIARRRKVQDPMLPWPTAPTSADLHDSSSCLLGPVTCRTDRPNHPFFRCNLTSLVHEFWKLRENQWLTALEPLPFEEWLERFPNTRRQQLRDAREEAYRHGLESKDAIMAVFIKTETSTSGTDPRNISPRQLKFLSVLGPFVAAVEKQAKCCEYLVKGKNPEERGQYISQYWRHSVIETDFSRFDMTVSADFVKTVERSMFRRAFPEGLYPALDECLDLLPVMTGASSLGVLYSVAGTRASGDAHTSIANGVLNRFVIWASLRNMDPSTWVSFHEGDDGIIHCDSAVTQQICDYLAFAAFLGFKLKVVRPPSHEHANFCGRHTCEECHREFCDLPRALSKFHITFKQGEPRSLLLAKALSYFATDAHTPIIGTMCDALIRHLSPQVSDRLMRRRLHAMSRYDRDRTIRGMHNTFMSPSACCRAAISNVCGWDPKLQVAWEAQLATWRYGITEISPLSVEDHLVDTDSVTIYQG